MLRVIRRLALLLILFAASAAPAFEFDADEPPGTNIRVSPRGVALADRVCRHSPDSQGS
jgi:hypothetical protein